MPNEQHDAVSLREVSRTYARSDDTVNALDKVSLDILEGTTCAVTGPSGCGKSTLLSLVAGLDRPTSGTVCVFGRTLSELSEDDLADFRRNCMGFVFQNYHLIPTLNVCENVMLPLIPVTGSSLELKGRALACIEQVGLEKRINHLPSELSGGEQQRVGLARALINRPKLILADEPTGNLDAEAAAAILKLLFDLAAENGSTVLLTTHDLAVADRCARRIRLENGCLVST